MDSFFCFVLVGLKNRPYSVMELIGVQQLNRQITVGFHYLIKVHFLETFANILHAVQFDQEKTSPLFNVVAVC